MVGTMWGKGRTYDEFTVGEKFVFRLPTVTEAYVNNFCCITGDFNPLHVDIEVAKKTIHGERIAPGTLTTSLTFTTFAMLAFGTGAALPLMLLGVLSREALMRWRGRLMETGKAGKTILGVALIAVGVLVATNLDKRLEAILVDASPEWLTQLTTRF